MGEKITYDYFYGGQLEAFSYYRLPRVLVTGLSDVVKQVPEAPTLTRAWSPS